MFLTGVTQDFEEMLETLRRANINYACAGRNMKEAEAPAVLEVKGKGRVLIFSYGSVSSGIPQQWGGR